ncbi:hypothetical protein CHISP_3752 [Chitinispirillum alkaliphilum]|nr:hypothetical protein CHISP_3752 [Chitinispirillum alkaliphilum]
MRNNSGFITIEKRLAHYFFVPAIILSCSIVCQCRNSNSDQPFATWRNLNMGNNYIRLSDEQYFSDPMLYEDKIVKQMRNDRFTGIQAGAPGIVNIEEKSSLPLVTTERRSFKEIENYPSFKFLIAVSIDLDRGDLYWDMLEHLPDNVITEIPDDDPLDEPIPVPKGWSAPSYLIDMRGQLGINWQPANLLTTVFLYNSYSNRILTSLVTKDLPDKESISHFIGVEMLETKNVSDSNVLPSLPENDSPLSKPTEHGLFLSTQNTYYLNDKGPLIISGALLLPVYPNEIVDKKDETNSPVAMVPVSILVYGSNKGVYGIYQLQITADIIDENNKPTALSFFTIRIPDDIYIGLSEQNYTIYAMSRQYLSKTSTFEVVKELEQ